MRAVPRRTVVGDIDRRFDNLSGSHHQSHVNCVSSVYGMMDLSCPLGIRALSRKYADHALVFFSHIINPLLTKRKVKMAGYWPRSFFACLWSRSIITHTSLY